MATNKKSTTSVLDSIPEKQAKTTKSSIKTVSMKGDTVSRFAKAKEDLEAAQREMTELAPRLQENGLKYVFTINCENCDKPKEMISSVNFIDADQVNGDGLPKPEASRVQFSWVKRNLKNDPEAVKAMFGRVTNMDGKPVNWEDYCEWQVGATFDDKVFVSKNAEGQAFFDEKKYTTFMKAIAKVAQQLKVAVPLSLFKTFAPKADFHQRRFKDFDAETNLQIMSVLPTSVALEAIRDNPL
jgi:hypothetical protein